MSEFRRMILKVSSITNDVATIPTTNDHQDGSWLDTDIYIGELFLNVADDILQTRTDTGIVEVYGGAGGVPEWGNIIGTLSNQTDLQDALDTKQIELVSGTNIKTIGGATILGSGNIDLGVTSIMAGTNVTINPIGGTGAVMINASGGGGVSELIQSLDTVDLATNQWAVADDNNNWKSQSLNSNGGTGAEPSLYFKNRFFLKDKTALSDFYLHWTTSSIGGQYEIFVVSFDFATNLGLNNKQILVNETFLAMGGAPFKKTDFVISTNNLSPDSILMVSIRAIDSNDTIKGLTMYYEFSPQN